MSIIFTSIITAFFVTLLVTPVIIKLFLNLNIFDKPGGRRIHTKITPSMGGVAIFIGFFMSMCLWIPDDQFTGFKYLYGALMFVFLTGIRDDLMPLNASKKLLCLIIAASIVVIFGETRLYSFYSLGIVGDFPEWFSILASIFTIIALSNAFNLVDGIDGLASSVASITLSFLGIWFYLVGEYSLSILMGAMLGGVLAFLIYNWHPAKIFMGDTGSLILGFFLSVALIKFININYSLSESNIYRLDASVGSALAIMIYPIYDTLRIFTIRITQGRSPFSPDKLHIHHLLLRMGLKHNQVTTCVIILSSFYIAFTVYLGSILEDKYFILALISSIVMINIALRYRVKQAFFKRDKQKIKEQQRKGKTKEITFNSALRRVN